MTVSLREQSATIYQFPVGGRAGFAASGGERHQIDKAALPGGGECVSTDAWYHQEAIHDAHQATKQ